MIKEKRFYMKVRLKGIGPGGWDCNCCGPAPKHKAPWVKVSRKREAKLFSDLIQQDLDSGN